MSINKQYLRLNEKKIAKIENLLGVARKRTPLRSFKLDSMEKRVVPLPNYESLGDRNLVGHFKKRGILQTLMRTGVVDEKGELSSQKRGVSRGSNSGNMDQSLEMSARRSSVIMQPDQQQVCRNALELQHFYQNQFIKDQKDEAFKDFHRGINKQDNTHVFLTKIDQILVKSLTSTSFWQKTLEKRKEQSATPGVSKNQQMRSTQRLFNGGHKQI